MLRKPRRIFELLVLPIVATMLMLVGLLAAAFVEIGWPFRMTILAAAFVTANALFAKVKRTGHLLTGIAIILGAFLYVIIWAIPIHSMGWRNISRVTVESLDDDDWRIEVTNPGMLAELEAISRKGGWRSTLIAISRAKMVVTDEAGQHEVYFNYYDGKGEAWFAHQGASMQPFFVPDEARFTAWANQLLPAEFKARKPDEVGILYRPHTRPTVVRVTLIK